MKKRTLLIIISSISLLISLLIAPLRAGTVSIGTLTGFKLTSVLALFIYYFYTLFCLCKTRDSIPSRQTVLFILIGFSVIRLPYHTLYFNSTLLALLEYIMHILPVLGGWIGYKILKRQKGLTLIFSFLFFLSGIWLSTTGYNYWLNKGTFNSFSGWLQKPTIIKDNFHFQNSRGDTLSIKEFQGKYVVLDFWYTYCGYCFRAFPEFEEIYQRYNKNDEVVIAAIHARLTGREETYFTGETILKEKGYSFPCFSVDIQDQVLKELGVTSYPSILIFDKNGDLIIRSRTDLLMNHLKKLLHD